MEFKSNVLIRGLRKTKCEIEGKSYDNTKVFIEMDLDDSAGMARGVATQPFEFGLSTEYDKLSAMVLPCQAEVTFEFVTSGKEKKQRITSISPARQANAAVKAPV